MSQEMYFSRMQKLLKDEYNAYIESLSKPLYRGMRINLKKAELDEFENSMPYDFVPGAEEFLHSLKSAAIPMAVVTSSNARKMEVVFNRRPQLRALFDHVLMSEDFTESKPSTQCLIRAMEKFGARPSKTIVFEDSVSGLQAGKASGATLVGLTTTNPASVVSQYADYVIPDFVGRSLSDFPLIK